MLRQPPISTRTDTLLPSTTLFRAIRARVKSGRVEFQDAELPALRLRVSPTSAAWSVLKRIPGGPMSRVLIGKADDVAAGCSTRAPLSRPSESSDLDRKSPRLNSRH